MQPPAAVCTLGCLDMLVLANILQWAAADCFWPLPAVPGASPAAAKLPSATHIQALVPKAEHNDTVVQLLLQVCYDLLLLLPCDGICNLH